MINIILSAILLFITTSSYAGDNCSFQLWPNTLNVIDLKSSEKNAVIKNLKKRVNHLLPESPKPLKTLTSASITSLEDTTLQASREGFKDADRASNFAILYFLTRDTTYFDKSKEILLAWSHTNIPTGHPINESRLTGFYWAYDLIQCQLSQHDRDTILTWFNQIYIAKSHWIFTKTTQWNNYHVNQIYSQLLLSKLLNQTNDYQHYLNEANILLQKNLDSSGNSLDYQTRHALYYQAFTLSAWLNIAILTGHLPDRVNKAYLFLLNKIKRGEITHEFVGTTNKTDLSRSRNHFNYATQNGTFDITKITSIIYSYHTIQKSPFNAIEKSIIDSTKPSPSLSFVQARLILWNRKPYS